MLQVGAFFFEGGESKASQEDSQMKLLDSICSGPPDRQQMLNSELLE